MGGGGDLVHTSSITFQGYQPIVTAVTVATSIDP